MSFEGEVGCRNAISRAYYAMYHKASETLEGIPQCHHDHHSNLIKYMRGDLGLPNEKISSGKLKTLGYALRQMRQSRNESDYRIDQSVIDKSVAEESILSAEWFFKRISK